MNKKISIVLAEEQSIFRTVLANYLNAQWEFEVKSDVSCGKELMDTLKRRIVDVVIMDEKILVENGYKALDMIRNRYPSQKVIIFSVQDSPEIMNELYERGASGFVSKLDPIEILSEAIIQVHNKGSFMHKKLSLAKQNKVLITQSSLLSQKELNVIKEVCNGLSNNQISDRLLISASTVDFHKKNIYRKTGSRNVIDVIRYALRNKIISIN